MPKLKYIVLGHCIAALLIHTSFAKADTWPSPAQIAEVHQKRTSFPVGKLVSDVDWYSPLEIVKGATHPKALPIRSANHGTISTSAIANALAYATEQKSYALLVWHKGKLELEHYWPGFDRSSRYDTASMHKTVVVLALGVAIAEGKIKSVNDPLETYLPDLKGTQRGAMPLRAYLEMASGIETPPSNGGDESPYWQYSFGNDLRAAAAHWPDTCVAQTEFCYANANSQYLGFALQAATGARYADYLSDKLWRPIGANDARIWLDHEGGSPRFSCCLQATAQDWVRVGLLILNSGKVGHNQLIPASWINQMTAPSPSNPNYGWQIWRGSPYNPMRRYGKNIRAIVPAKEPFGRKDTVYTDGSGAQRVYVIPSEKLVIVRIGEPAYLTWDDSRLPNLILAGLK